MSSKPQYCVYVLYSLKDHQLYIGFTTDLKQRLTDQFNGKVESTSPRRPFKLIHCEYYLAKSDAERREKYLKTAKGRRTLRLMLQNSLSELNAGPQS